MNKELINTFYEAFSNLDSKGMVACYHNDIEFSDPAFGKLSGKRAGDMWRMLCNNAKDFTIEYSKVTADELTGSAYWQATYTFSKTGRRVVNKISAEFEFQDGKIIRHIDSFNLHTWAKQAFGIKGLLLGSTAFFKNKLNAQTNKLLDKFIGENPS
jgi:ketosteroid isomerase-like protein